MDKGAGFALRGSELPIHGGIQAEADCGEVPTARSDQTQLDPFRAPLGRMGSPDDTSGISPLKGFTEGAGALGKQGPEMSQRQRNHALPPKCRVPNAVTPSEKKGPPALPAR